MPTTTSITTTYAGESQKKYISAALFSGATLANNAIEINQNVKYKDVIKKLATGSLLADGTCDFTATSSVTTTERFLEPKELQVNLQLCKSDFRSDWEAIEMGMSAHDNLPPTFADYLLSHVVEKVAEEVEIAIWQGDSATDGDFDGFIKLMEADADVIDQTILAITDANVVTELRKATNQVPDRLYGSDKLRIYAPTNVVRAYIQSLGGFGANGQGANGINGEGQTWRSTGALFFDGIEIFLAQGLPADHIVIAESDNLWFGTGLLNDSNEVKVLDMADLDGSQNVRMVLRMTGCVNYGIGSEIVLAQTA